MLKQLTTGTQNVLSLAEAKAHCKVETDDEDYLLESWIDIGLELAEAETGFDFREHTYLYYLDGFPDLHIPLPKCPLATVDEIEYYNTANVLTVLSSASYYVITPDWQTGYISTATEYPDTYSTYPRPDCVQITFTTGLLSPPQMLKHFLRLFVEHCFNNRDIVITGTIINEIPWGAKRILNNLALWGVK